MPRKYVQAQQSFRLSEASESTDPLWFSHSAQDIGTRLNVNPEKTAIPHLVCISLHKGTAILLLVWCVMELFNSH